MVITKTGKKNLFRMTTKRKIMMDRIITTLNIRLNSVDEDGLSRLFALEIPLEEKRKQRIMELDSELQELSLLHDVLEAVSCHEVDWLLSIHMKEDRGWRNEWDVPLDVFNESIEKVISLLKWFQQRENSKNDKKYEEKIEFLLMLKEFRNN